AAPLLTSLSTAALRRCTCSPASCPSASFDASAAPATHTLSLHDALPISRSLRGGSGVSWAQDVGAPDSPLQARRLPCGRGLRGGRAGGPPRPRRDKVEGIIEFGRPEPRPPRHLPVWGGGEPAPHRAAPRP